MIEYTRLPDDWLQILHRMLEGVEQLLDSENEPVCNLFIDIQRIIRTELSENRRPEKELESIYDDFEKRERGNWITDKAQKLLPRHFDIKEMDEKELKLWFCVSSEIEDFSCLGNGVRPYIDAIWFATTKELEIRNISCSPLLEELKF